MHINPFKSTAIEYLTRHEILHVHGLLPLLVVLDADGGEGEEDGGAEGHADADPADDIRPVVLELGVVGQLLGPGLHEELDVAALVDLHLLVVLHAVPETHSSGAQETWNRMELQSSKRVSEFFT